MTVEELLVKVNGMVAAFDSCNKTLEEYWRSMYPLALKKIDHKPTLQLFLELLDESIKGVPMEMDPKWLDVTNPPESNMFTEEVKNGRKNIESGYPDHVFFLKVLEFQISDLHKMKDDQLKNGTRYFGVTSGTGNKWFNFTPISVLECGLAGMHSHGFNRDPESWIFLGEIIEMGRIYE